MAQIIVMYPHPADAAEFDRYYADVHTPLALKIPGLKGLTVSKGDVSTPAGASDYHRVAVLSYESMDALAAASASPEGQATVADLANFAPPGTQVFIMDTEQKVE